MLKIIRHLTWPTGGVVKKHLCSVPILNWCLTSGQFVTSTVFKPLTVGPAIGSY